MKMKCSSPAAPATLQIQPPSCAKTSGLLVWHTSDSSVGRPKTSVSPQHTHFPVAITAKVSLAFPNDHPLLLKRLAHLASHFQSSFFQLWPVLCPRITCLLYILNIQQTFPDFMWLPQTVPPVLIGFYVPKKPVLQTKGGRKQKQPLCVCEWLPTYSFRGCEVTQERYRMSTMNGKQSGCAIKLAFWGSAGHLSLSAPNPLARTARPWVCHCALNLKWGGCQLKASHHCLLEGQYSCIKLRASLEKKIWCWRFNELLIIVLFWGRETQGSKFSFSS